MLSFRVGIILVCDALGAEMNGSRTLMQALGTIGAHVIKPMIYENDQNTFMNMLVSYYFKAEKPRSFPPEIEATVNFFKKQKNISKIGIIGVCWGGCIAQHIMSGISLNNSPFKSGTNSGV